MVRMIKYKYISNAEAVLKEIQESVSADEKKLLKEFLHDKTPEHLYNIERSFRKEVFLYIRLNPKQRLKEKRWSRQNMPYYRSLIAYISFNYMQRCAYLLKHLSKLPEENGIREIIASVALFINDACFKKFSESFFDG